MCCLLPDQVMAWGRPAVPSAGPTRVGDRSSVVAAAGPPASQGSPRPVASTPSERLCPLPWEGAKLLLLSLGSPRRLSWATPSPQRTWTQRRRQCCSGSTVSWRIRLVRMGWECGGVGTSPGLAGQHGPRKLLGQSCLWSGGALDAFQLRRFHALWCWVRFPRAVGCRCSFPACWEALLRVCLSQPVVGPDLLLFPCRCSSQHHCRDSACVQAAGVCCDLPWARACLHSSCPSQLLTPGQPEEDAEQPGCIQSIR